MTPSDEYAEKVEKIARATINYLINHPDTSKSKITNIKAKFAKKFSHNGVIKNATILDHASKEEREIITQILKRRKTRTNSGVSIIAIMTKPLPCPGNCVFCPGEKSQPGEHVAQSYTGKEPAAMRSIHNEYNPFKQVQSRIQDLEAIGHKVDKIELIIMGGTFLSSRSDYQEEFIKGALEGVIQKRVKGLDEAKDLAERSQRRVIGITIETRPDYCKEPDVDKMLRYGTTRVEIGIQTVYDDIYEKIRRGHSTLDSIEAIRIAKDSGLKVNAHVMPNLPGSTYAKDIATFNHLFSNPDYRPDMLKIYPCLVIKGTDLHEWWKDGKFFPYSTEELVSLLSTIKTKIPPYVRIQRIMRDIPAPLIEAGCKNSNLRQLIQQKLMEGNFSCNCIRCREYGIIKKDFTLDDATFNDIKFYREDYDASKGREVFLSYENKKEKYLLGYLRLRKPSEHSHRPELNDGKTMIIREIKVVGELVPKDSKPKYFTQIQHKGWGKLLMRNAEEIAVNEFDAKKVAVISGIGVRGWFYQQGYTPDGPYVSKIL